MKLETKQKLMIYSEFEKFVSDNWHTFHPDKNVARNIATSFICQGYMTAIGTVMPSIYTILMDYDKSFANAMLELTDKVFELAEKIEYESSLNKIAPQAFINNLIINESSVKDVSKELGKNYAAAAFYTTYGAVKQIFSNIELYYGQHPMKDNILVVLNALEDGHVKWANEHWKN